MFRIPFVLSVSIFSLTEGWSGDAHRVIAKIAAQFLNHSGKYFVAEHLADGGDASKVEKALIEHSIYADSVEWSHDLHFSHTPYRACAPFEMERDCPLVDGSRRCIVTAIANYTMRASDLGLSVEERAEAIKFLIHLIGDIHNPLHVGFLDDRGGTQIHLSNPSGETLHSVWDDVLIHRKQVELGVYKERGEAEEAQPWKLSEALLDELSGVKAAHPYILNIQGAAGIDIATAMASETALAYTCEFAYKKEESEWIKGGESLSEEYFGSRTEAAMELMKFSGIRLAEILNHIGKVFSTKKYEERANAQKAEIPAPVDANRFAVLVLDFHFDPEEHLFDEKDAVGEKLEATQTTVSPLSSGLSASQKKKQRKARSQRIIESAVLIKRKAHFVVTGAELVGPEYFPYLLMEYRVRFVGNEEAVLFLFDSLHFGVHVSDGEFIKKTLKKIGKIPTLGNEKNDEPAEEMSTVNKGEFNIAPFAGQIKVENRRNQIIYAFGGTSRAERLIASVPEDGVSSKQSAKNRRSKLNKKWKDVLLRNPSKEELLEFQVKENYRDICILERGPLVFFVHRKTLEDSSVPMIKANLFPMVPPEGSPGLPAVFVMIDTQIVDGLLSSAIVDLLLDAKRENKKSCEALLRKRSSLMEELRDLYIMLFGESWLRVNTLNTLKYFTLFRRDDDLFYRMHWSVHPELDRWPVQQQVESPAGK